MEDPLEQYNVIQAVFLGFSEVARNYLVSYFKRRDPDSRFVVFYEAAADWRPNQQTGNIAMLALLKMIIQIEGARIMLLPAWPKKWDVEFRLRAPYNTTVEGIYRGGRLEQLTVTPRSRAGDVECALL
jgi:hypothetical protein